MKSVTVVGDSASLWQPGRKRRDSSVLDIRETREKA